MALTARVDIRSRMWLALGILALATVLTGAFAWNSLDRADTRLQLLHVQTLDDVTDSIRLSRQPSDIAAAASYLLSFETRFLIEQEGAALSETLTRLLSDWPDHTPDQDTGAQTVLLEAVREMEASLVTLIDAALAVISWVDERQRIEARLCPLERDLYEASTNPNLSIEARGQWLNLLAMAGELSGAARADNLLGIGEHQRNFQRLDRTLAIPPGSADLTLARQALRDALGQSPTLFGLCRQELNSRLSAESALFRISAAAACVNALAADFARQSEVRLSSARARTTTSIAFAKTMIVLIGLGTIVMALSSAIYVSNYVTGNIKAVAEAMTRLVAGERGTRLRRYVEADDEIGKLFRAFRVFRTNAGRLDRSNTLLNEKNAQFERLFTNISDEIAITEADGRITACNAHVASVLRLTDPPEPGSDVIHDVIARSGFADGSLPQAATPDVLKYRELTNADGLTVETRSGLLPDGGKVWLFSDETERRQLQDRLQQIQHIEALGKMSGEVAHDFGNVLSSITTNLHLLETSDLNARRQTAFTGLRNTTDLGAALVQRLLAFAKRQPLSPEIIELTALVRGPEDLISIGLGSGVHLHLSLPSHPAWIPADPGQLESALPNLCLNASQAIESD